MAGRGAPRVGTRRRTRRVDSIAPVRRRPTAVALAALVALTVLAVTWALLQAPHAGPLHAVAPKPTTHDLRATAGGSTARPVDVVALGDSVPSGAACGCVPFPVLYGRLLAHRTGSRVTVDDEGVNGLDTTGLVDQLRQRTVASAVRRAQVVLVTIGANDFSDHHDDVTDGDCGAVSECVDDEVAAVREGLGSALDRVRALRAGRPTTVLVTGYWNVFEDGDVALGASGAAGLEASLTLTRRVNAAIRGTARSAGAAYVDLFPAFQASGHDITGLLADDGDHPDAAGHALIARTLVRAGRPLLR